MIIPAIGLEHDVDIMMANSKASAETRLATFGTLAPGRGNNHQLAGLNGGWWQGTVTGRLVEAGWGAKA